MKKTKSIVVIACMLVGLALPGINVKAKEPDQPRPTATSTDAEEASYDEMDGIAKISIVYKNQNSAREVIRSGYGFFIKDKSNKIYIVTTYDSVILTDKEKKTVADQHSTTVDKIAPVIELYNGGDVGDEVSITNTKESENLAILGPVESVGVGTALKLSLHCRATEDDDVLHTYYEDLSNKDSADKGFLLNESKVLEWDKIADRSNTYKLPYFKYNSDKKLSEGLPLINKDGEVVAITMNVDNGQEESTYYALQIEQVLKFLEKKVDIEEAINVDTKGLEVAMANFEAVLDDKDSYTEESWNRCEDAYDEASHLMNEIENGNVTVYTQNQIKELKEKLNDRVDGLKKAGISAKLVIIIASIVTGVLFISIIVLIIILIVKTKKYKRLLREEENNTVKAREALKISGRITPGNVYNNSNMPKNRSLNEASENLMQESNETTVLGADNVAINRNTANLANIRPTLIRCKSGERVKICQNSFIIGSSFENVDYYIENNNISRKHASILRFEDGFYIQDLGTTNGTFINGVRVTPGRYVKLESGNIIKLAEEEFEFDMT